MLIVRDYAGEGFLAQISSLKIRLFFALENSKRHYIVDMTRTTSRFIAIQFGFSYYLQEWGYKKNFVNTQLCAQNKYLNS